MPVTASKRPPRTPGRPPAVRGSSDGVPGRGGAVHSVLMGRTAAVVPYVLALVAVVVGVDVLFFRHQFWERLTVNVGIVLVFGAFYFRFLRRW
ncbi:MAG: hypothetical protein QOG80_3046 [Pseudonocardiales bacterium]|nr:hypothetical protein [Pseudonocardiales bacterium]